MPGIVLQQLSAELVRIPADRNSGFINKGFREKAMLRVVNTAPGSERNMYRTADVANIARQPGRGSAEPQLVRSYSYRYFPTRPAGHYCRKLPEIDSVRQAGRNPDGRLLPGPDQLDRTAN